MAKNASKPNIVFILTDDQGYWALGCYDNPEIRTPNLDSLAARGMRFSNFFCASPVCSPARASILTGRIPSQHGVHDWIRKGNMGKQPIEYLKGQLAYTEILAKNGYTCGLSGKWHLGDSLRPQKGFSHWFVHQTGGSPFYDAPMIRDGKPYIEKRYTTDVMTEDALQFIDNHADDDEPFYIGVHYTAPHSPWIDNHPQEIVDSYDDCTFAACPQEPKHPWSPPRLGYLGAPDTWEDMDIRENLKGYYAAVTAMDTNVGKIIKKIEDYGLTENTLFIFLSDNGFNCGHHGIWGKGNGTLPLNMYDTSIKVPCIMSHVGSIPQNEVNHDMLSAYDIMPTLLDYLGFENPEADRLPGKSFNDQLHGRQNAGHDEVFIFDEYGPVRMIRTEEWKYVHRYPFGPHELYDIKNDPNEAYNLINYKDRKPIIVELRKRMENWFCRYTDPNVDGTKEAVTGKGQINLCGTKSNGEESFHPFHTVAMPITVSIWEPNNPGGE